MQLIRVIWFCDQGFVDLEANKVICYAEECERIAWCFSEEKITNVVIYDSDFPGFADDIWDNINWEPGNIIPVVRSKLEALRTSQLHEEQDAAGSTE